MEMTVYQYSICTIKFKCFKHRKNIVIHCSAKSSMKIVNDHIYILILIVMYLFSHRNHALHKIS